jgi:hypothetical protein
VNYRQYKSPGTCIFLRSNNNQRISKDSNCNSLFLAQVAAYRTLNIVNQFAQTLFDADDVFK